MKVEFTLILIYVLSMICYCSCYHSGILFFLWNVVLKSLINNDTPFNHCLVTHPTLTSVHYFFNNFNYHFPRESARARERE